MKDRNLYVCLIHLFLKYLLHAFYVLGTLIDTGDLTVKVQRLFLPMGANGPRMSRGSSLPPDLGHGGDYVQGGMLSL